MEYVKLGNSGLEVSRICLGCMGFGETHNEQNARTLSLEEARPIINYALDLGINFFDNANQYSNGTSERIVGQVLNEAITLGKVDRDELVITSKLYYPMAEGPNHKGLSRKIIFSEVEKSLERLQLDYLDLYIIHRFDYTTPVEETMEALHDLVKLGKVRYIGASSMYAWQFQKCQYIAEKHGWTKFISMQDLQNLLYREEEREMIPLCKDMGVGMTPWSPLAHGRLVKEIDELNNETAEDVEIIHRVHELALKKKVPRAAIALAWLFTNKQVTAPIVGASKMTHLDDAMMSLEVELTKEEKAYLEEPYKFREIAYFR